MTLLRPCTLNTLSFFQSLTNGNGFYQMTYKETINKDRKIILRDLKKNGALYEDITNKKRPGKLTFFCPYLLSKQNACSIISYIYYHRR